MPKTLLLFARKKRALFRKRAWNTMVDSLKSFLDVIQGYRKEGGQSEDESQESQETEDEGEEESDEENEDEESESSAEEEQGLVRRMGKVHVD